jgi:hypothetical protein
MSRFGKIARRTFLIGSAAIAGGVAFGVYMVRRDPANPLAGRAGRGGATFNPWVLIDGERVTLITPHADKGQGVVSSQAALIAEELDIEFGQFEISFGPPSAAYWNTAMAEEAVPFRPPTRASRQRPCATSRAGRSSSSACRRRAGPPPWPTVSTSFAARVPWRARR